MSVRRVGNRWQVRVRLGRGRARIERTLLPSAKLADAKILEAQIRRAHIDSEIGRKPRYLIDDAIDQWVKTSAKHLRSWEKDIRFRLDILRGYTAGKPLEQLVDVAEKVKAKGLAGGTLTPASINRYLALLRRVGNLAERWGWTDKPLGRRVQLLPERSERHVYLSPAEVQRVAKHAEPVTADAIRFAALTGLRRGELLPLKPEQIKGRLLILDANTKSGRPRGIPIPPEAVRIARRRLPWGLTQQTLWERFKAAREAAGLPKVRWHDLRHTYASWLVQGGKSLSSVRDLLGHSSLAVTNRYAHLAPAHLADAITVLPTLGEKPGKKRSISKRKKAA